MNHDIHGRPIKTTQRDDWWMPGDTARRRRRPARKPGRAGHAEPDSQGNPDTCIICDRDIFDDCDPVPYCRECREGYEEYGSSCGGSGCRDDLDRRRSGRLGHGDDTATDREGMMENGVRGMEDGT